MNIISLKERNDKINNNAEMLRHKLLMNKKDIYELPIFTYYYYKRDKGSIYLKFIDKAYMGTVRISDHSKKNNISKWNILTNINSNYVKYPGETHAQYYFSADSIDEMVEEMVRYMLNIEKNHKEKIKEVKKANRAERRRYLKVVKKAQVRADKLNK